MFLALEVVLTDRKNFQALFRESLFYIRALWGFLFGYVDGRDRSTIWPSAAGTRAKNGGEASGFRSWTE